MSKPRISESDLCRAAKRLGTSTAEIQTFLAVETRGVGFDDQDRPIILFERHWFHKFTRGKYDADYPGISNAEPGGYGPAAKQYERFSRAFNLNAEAAMKSASWGIGQVMGFNYAICGYPTVDAFVDAMKQSEGKQLDAAISYVVNRGLDDELRRHDWEGFAHGYNGDKYKRNQYDTKLAIQYAKFSKKPIDCSNLSAAAAPDTANPQTESDVSAANSDPLSGNSPTNAPPPITQPVEVKKESPSLFAKVGAGITAITGLGINAGALIQKRLEDLTLPQLAYLGGALALVALSIWWYRKSAKAAQLRTMQLVDKAADPTQNTVVLK